MSVWASPDLIQNYEWALTAAVAILPNYEILFDYPYFLPKLDIVAIPDFAFLAMEEWGLLFYDQDRIAIAPGTSPLSYRWDPSLLCSFVLHCCNCVTSQSTRLLPFLPLSLLLHCHRWSHAVWWKGDRLLLSDSASLEGVCAQVRFGGRHNCA